MGRSAASWEGGGGMSRPLTIACCISSPSPPRTMSSSSPKSELKLRVLSAGEPGASCSLASTAAGTTPLETAEPAESPFARSPAPEADREPPETPFTSGSRRTSSQTVLAVCERNSIDDIWPPDPANCRVTWPVLRSQSFTFRSQDPESSERSSAASVSTDTADVCLRSVVMIFPSSCRTDCRFIPPLWEKGKINWAFFKKRKEKEKERKTSGYIPPAR